MPSGPDVPRRSPTGSRRVLRCSAPLRRFPEPLWELTDLGDEARPIQEFQLRSVHESAEHLVLILEDFAAAMAETDVPDSDGYPILASDVRAVREKPSR